MSNQFIPSVGYQIPIMERQRALPSRPSTFLMICLLGFPQISETIYTPSLPDLANALGMTMGQAELTLSSYFVGFAFGVLVWGSLSDRIGRRRGMLLGIALYVLGGIGCHASMNFHSLLTWRFLQSFGASVGSVLTQTMVRDLFSGARRSQVFATLMAALAFSPALGPFIGGGLDQSFGWRANFLFLIGMGVFLLIYSFLRLRETRPDNVNPVNSKKLAVRQLIARMITDPTILCHVVLVGITNGIIFSYYAEAPFLFIDVLHLAPTAYGSIGLLIATSTLVASALARVLARHYLGPRIMLFGAGVVALGSSHLSIAAEAHWIRPDNFWVWAAVLGPVGLIFIGLGLIVPFALSNALARYTDNIGSAGSLFGFAYYLVIAGLTALMSALHDGTTSAMPTYFVILSVPLLAVSVYNLCQESRPRRLERPA